MEELRGKKIKVYCTLYDAPGHFRAGHPESPKRLAGLQNWLKIPPYPEIQWLDFDLASEEDLLLVHKKRFLTALKAECQKGSHVFEYAPSYVTKESYISACTAVGGTLAVSRKIISEGTGRGFAIVRPPGHHAEPDASKGFCLLNNIAIAAADALAHGLRKVAIIDLDAHHGNGTEAAFRDKNKVGYLSIHKRDIYPRTGLIVSEPHARGRIINIPLPAYSGNKTYRQLMNRVIKPWVGIFNPEMLFVSMGFDAHFSDKFTALTLDTVGYHELATHLIQLADDFCQGRIVFVLEGGYDPEVLQENIQACLAAMSDHEDFTHNFGPAPYAEPDVSYVIGQLLEMHQLKEA